MNPHLTPRLRALALPLAFASGLTLACVTSTIEADCSVSDGGEANTDGDEFYAVAVSHAGDYAIALGVHKTGSGSETWLIKVSI